MKGFGDYLLEQMQEWQERKRARKTVSALIIAVMIAADGFFLVRAVGKLEAADRTAVQTEAADGQEAEELKEELKNTAYFELCLVPVIGLVIAVIGIVLDCWADS